MLQPSGQQQLMTARIIWAALTFSMVIYGLVLKMVGKIAFVAAPSGELSPIQYVALGANVMAIAVYFLHQKLVANQKGITKRLPGYIVGWALNESIAIIGFVAVFLSEDGNGFFYAANALVGITGNLLTFPKD